jgi:glycerol-3-phosphate dehydrogenase (NAD+)
MEEILASTSEVAEGVDTSIALVNLIKAECKGYRLDLKKNSPPAKKTLAET